MKKFILSLWLATLLMVTPVFAIDPGLVQVTEVDTSPNCWAYKLIFSNASVTSCTGGVATIVTGAGGGGDVSSNTATSVVNEVALFQDTSGKVIKRATMTGLPYITSGVLGTSKVTLTQPGTGSTLTILDGKTFTVNKTMTLTGADDTSVITMPAGAKTLVSTTDLAAYATLADPTFTGTVTLPAAPFTVGATAVTTTGTQFNYLKNATGTTGTDTTNIVFSTSPTFVTPTLGAATATSINKVAFTAPASGSTLRIEDGKTLRITKTMQLTSADDTTVATFPAGAVTVGVTGTLTNTKWCYTDGTSIICNQDAPTGSGTITAVGDITSGVAFTAAGPGKTLIFNNATSGTITIQAVTGALGTGTVFSLPAQTGTAVVGSNTIYLNGPNAARTVTWPNNDFTLSIPASKALTLAGSLTTTGAYDVSFTIPGAYTYTFPGATKTLAASDGSNLAFGSDARGDIAVMGASTYGRVAKGSSGAVLTGDGTDTKWSTYLLSGTTGQTYTFPSASKTVAASDASNLAVGSDARGDMLARGATAYVRLPVGSNNQILTTNGTDPSWSSYGIVGTSSAIYTFPAATKTIAANDGSNWTLSSQAQGDVFYASSGSAMARLAAGTQYKFLITNSTSANPSWSAYTMPASIATGDTIYGSGTNAVSALTAGAAGKLLRMGASIPAWSTLTLADTIAAGSVVIAQAGAANTLTALTSTSGTYFLKNIDGTLSWATGVGTMGGSTGSTDNAILRADGTGGVTIQSSGATIDDSGNISATSFIATALDGSNKLVISNNTSISPTASSMEIYPEGNIWKANQNGTEYSVPLGATGNQIFLNGAFTSGGIPYGSAANTLSSTGALTSHGIVVMQGAATPPVVAVDVTHPTYPLFANTAADPTFRAIANGDLPVVIASKGGTGVANNDSSTLTITGNYGTTITLSGATTFDFSNLTTGDILLGDGTRSMSRLAKGTQYAVLQAGASTLAYSSVLYPASLTTNGVIYGASATGFGQTAAGTVQGQVFTTGATPFVPGWSAYYLSGTTGQTYTFPSSTSALATINVAQTYTAMPTFGHTNSAGGSGQSMYVSSTVGDMDGSDTYSGLLMTITNGTHTGGSNTINGISIAGITGSANATERALNIGAGWDHGLYTTSPVYVGDNTNGVTISATGAITFAGTASIAPPAGTTLTTPNIGAATGTSVVLTGNGTFQGGSVIIGKNTSTIGTVKLFGNTSGDATITPPAIAGTSTVLTLPATTGTLALNNQTMYIGSTQVAINRATNPLTLAGITLTTPVIGEATGTSLLASGIVDGAAPIVITATSAGYTLGATYKSGYTFTNPVAAAAAFIMTLPSPAVAGLQYCVGNGAAKTGTLKVNAGASNIIDLDGTNGSAGGYAQATAVAGNFACFIGVDSTHWKAIPTKGTWTIAGP